MMKTTQHSVLKFTRLIAIALAALASAGQVSASTHVWGGINGNWNNAANWSSGGVPTNGEPNLVLIFPELAGTHTTTNNIGALAVTSLQLLGGNYTVRGAYTLTFGAAGTDITITGPGNVIESPLVLSNAATTDISVASASDACSLNGVVSGSGQLMKWGAGQLTLAGNNSFSGAFTILAGTVVATHNNSFGATTGGTIVNDGGGILLANGRTIGTEALTLTGAGAGSNGVLRVTGADSSWAGYVYVSGSALINVTDTNAVFTLSGTLDGGTQLTKTGPGRLTLTGTSANPFSGTINVVGGSLRLQKPGGIRAADSIFMDFGNVLELGAADQINDTATVALNYATFDLGGFNETLTALSLTGSAVTNSGSGVLTVVSNVVAAGSLCPLDTRLSLAGAPVKFDVGTACILSLNKMVAGAGGLKKSGSGTLYLKTANSYAGETTVAAGHLDLFDSASLGVTNGVTTLLPLGTLLLNLPDGSAPIAEPVYLISTNYPYNIPTLWVAGTNSTWSGRIDFYGAGIVHVAGSNAVFTTTELTGTFGALTKTGPGKLVLGGTVTNTLNSVSEVEEGALRLQKPNGVRAIGFLTMDSGTRLEWAADEQMDDNATLTLKDMTVEFENHKETLTGLGLLNVDFDTGPGSLTVRSDITLLADESFINESRIAGNLVLAGGTRWIYGESSYWNFLTLDASIREVSGSAGVNVQGCTLYLNASNSFSGPATIQNSSVWVADPHALGSPALGTSVENGSWLLLSLPDGGSIENEPLTLDADSHQEATMGGLVCVADRTNSWNGPIDVQEFPFVQVAQNSRLNLDGTTTGSGTIFKDGPGSLVLGGTGTNTLSGLVVRTAEVRLAKPPGVCAVMDSLKIAFDHQDSAPVVVTPDAPNQLGTNISVEIYSGGILDLNSHSQTIGLLWGSDTAVINTRAGTLTVNTPTGFYSSFYGSFYGDAGTTNLIKTGNGLGLEGTNHIAGDVLVQAGSMSFSQGFAGATTINAGAKVYHYATEFTFGSIAGAGELVCGSGRVNIGANNASTGFAGIISGSADTNFVKIGTGTLTLSGSNTATGLTLVQNGRLIVNGSLAGSVLVNAQTLDAGAMLAGNGSVLDVTLTGLSSRVAPGTTTNTPSYGKLKLRNLTMNPSTLYRCELLGTNAATDMDQLAAAGSINLNSASLDVSATGLGVISNRYTIIKSTGGSTVTGNFSGLSEGSFLFPAAGRIMQITYHGGASGRDVVLTELSQASNSEISGISQQPGGQMIITGTGEVGATYIIEANADLATTNWVNIGSVPTDWNGNISFTDTNAPNFPQRFYRFKLQ